MEFGKQRSDLFSLIVRRQYSGNQRFLLLMLKRRSCDCNLNVPPSDTSSSISDNDYGNKHQNAIAPEVKESGMLIGFWSLVVTNRRL